ncbi:MAG: AMP-binding protein, partial [Acidimicrobiales bacterium]
MTVETVQRGGTRPPVALHDLLRSTAVRTPQARALTFRSETLCYGELWDRVEAFARGLVSVGVQRGDRVAVLLDKRIETVVAIFGASAAGAVVVPANPLLRPHQVGHILGDCDVALLVTTAERYAPLRGEITTGTARRRVVLVGTGSVEVDGDDPPASSFEALCGAASTLPRSAVDSDMAAIFYTSGSTGRPKGVVVSHRNLIVGAHSVSSYLEQGGDDTVLSLLP